MTGRPAPFPPDGLGSRPAQSQHARPGSSGLIEGSTAGWTALPIGCLAAGAVLLAGFGVRQRLAADPLILPSLRANRGLTAGLLLGLAFFAAVPTAWPTSSRCSSRPALGLHPSDGRRSP